VTLHPTGRNTRKGRPKTNCWNVIPGMVGELTVWKSSGEKERERSEEKWQHNKIGRIKMGAGRFENTAV
jgi:hypothetical protein